MNSTLSLPPDLQRLREAMDEADRAAEAIAGRLTNEEFFWQPDQGRRWSVALCLDHLAVANAIYGAAIEQGVKTARERGWLRQRAAMPGFFGRKFVESLEPPARRRTSAPGKIKPQPSRSRDEILRAYREAHDRIRHLIDQAATVDVNRATFPNPFFSFVRVKVSTGFNVIAAHDRRHLWQAEQVEKQLLRRVE